jgi:cadmium resistance protein CadD (predicted permease)
MADIPGLMAIGIAGFAATNIDDIFVLMMFFSYSPKTFPPKQIVAGQNMGIGLLVAISALGFFSRWLSRHMS